MAEDHPKVQIGGVEYQTRSHLIGSDLRHTLEVCGKPDAGYRALLLIEQFGDMRVRDLPDRLDISIYHPNTPLGLIESFNILCGPRKGKVSFSVFYSPDSWRHPKNLWLYAKELSGKLLAELDEAKGASVGQDQGCVWIDIQSEIPSNAELRDYVIGLERRVHSVSEAIIGKKVIPESNSQQSGLKPDEKGFKWWLRYIIVPVLGSASLIGLLKFFVGQA